MDLVTIYYNNIPINIYIHNNKEDYLSRCINDYKQFYEYELLDFIKKRFPNQKNMIDIGANIGNHSLFFSKFIDCDYIYSFEPFEKNISIFRENLKSYQDKCILYTNALSNTNSKKILYNSEKDNYGGFSLHKQEKSFTVMNEIEVKTLDSFQLDNITFMKIDVENHENEVLLGARDTILKCKPIICLENSHHFFSNIFSDPEPHQQILNKYGYIKLYSNVCNSGMDIWIHNSYH